MLKLIKEWIAKDEIEAIRERFNKDQAERKRRSELKIDNAVQDFINQISAFGFAPTGTHWLPFSCIITMSTQDQMIWIQLHPDGKLMRIFAEINDNNLDRIIAKLTAPVDYAVRATEKINGALRIMIDEFGDELTRMLTPEPKYVPKVEALLGDAVVDLRRVENQI